MPQNAPQHHQTTQHTTHTTTRPSASPVRLCDVSRPSPDRHHVPARPRPCASLCDRPRRAPDHPSTTHHQTTTRRAQNVPRRAQRVHHAPARPRPSPRPCARLCAPVTTSQHVHPAPHHPAPPRPTRSASPVKNAPLFLCISLKSHKITKSPCNPSPPMIPYNQTPRNTAHPKVPGHHPSHGRHTTAESLCSGFSVRRVYLDNVRTR